MKYYVSLDNQLFIWTGVVAGYDMFTIITGM
jgi:hypothetical protein